jgi:hypothetical protein
VGIRTAEAVAACRIFRDLIPKVPAAIQAKARLEQGQEGADRRMKVVRPLSSRLNCARHIDRCREPWAGPNRSESATLLVLLLQAA